MSHSDYITTAQKFSRLLVNSIITVDEYAENLLNSCVCLPEIDGTTAHAVATTVPEIARERLNQEIEMVLASNYRFPELHYGGPGPSQELREEMRHLYETRIRACASALAAAFGEV